MENNIRKILAVSKNGGLKPSFQPIWDSGSKKILAFEVLARLQLPDSRMLLPDKFIPQILKDSNALLQFETMIWQSSIELIKNKKFMLHINLEESTLENAHTRKWLLEESKQNGIIFGIEITERVSLNKLQKHKGWLNKMAMLGNHIVLDDFDLKNVFEICNLPVHIVKLDRDITQNLCNNERSPITDHQLNRLRNMDIEIWAEGVETPEQGKTLNQYGIDVWQGWYVGGHMNANEAARVWHSTNHQPTICSHIDQSTKINWDAEPIDITDADPETKMTSKKIQKLRDQVKARIQEQQAF